MRIKPHTFLRGAILLADLERIEADILKAKNAQYHAQIFDGVISDFAPASTLSFARTTDERMAEIIRSGLIADLEAKKTAIIDELDDLNVEPPRPITIVQVSEPAVEAQDEAA